MNITAPMVFRTSEDAMEVAEKFPTNEEIKVCECEHGFVLYDGQQQAFTYERLVFRGMPLLKLMAYAGDI